LQLDATRVRLLRAARSNDDRGRIDLPTDVGGADEVGQQGGDPAA